MSTSTERAQGLDALRGFAVLLMFCTHVYHLSGNGKGYHEPVFFLDSVFSILNQIEPYIFALFIALSGFSFALTKKPSPRRYALLLFIAQVLFFIERGPQWPDGVFAPGPLFIIGMNLLVLYFFRWNRSDLKDKETTRDFLIGAFVIFFIFLNSKSGRPRVAISGINSGNGALMPHLFFGFFGYYLSFFYENRRMKLTRSLLFWTLSFGLLAFLAKLLFSFNYTVDRVSTYTTYGNNPTLIGWITGHLIGATAPTQIEASYWHYTINGVLYLLFPLALSFLVFLNWKKLQWKIFRRLGENSLFYYLAHLLVISTLFALGWYPRNALQSLGMVLAFTFGLPFIPGHKIKIR